MLLWLLLLLLLLFVYYVISVVDLISLQCVVTKCSDDFILFCLYMEGKIDSRSDGKKGLRKASECVCIAFKSFIFVYIYTLIQPKSSCFLIGY